MLVRVLYTRLDANPDEFMYSRGGIFIISKLVHVTNSLRFARTYAVASAAQKAARRKDQYWIRTYLRGGIEARMNTRGVVCFKIRTYLRGGIGKIEQFFKRFDLAFS